METFPRYWPFVRGIHRSPLNSSHKRRYDDSFDLRKVNNREAGDLRRYRAHCDVVVMSYRFIAFIATMSSENSYVSTSTQHQGI